ncbi:MAG TPA: MFS transporter [Longimicrobium sp.]|nr:MFS transporter [Longimicrobium sp.]
MAHESAAPPLQGRVEALVFFTVFLDLVGFGIVMPQLPFYIQLMGGSASTLGILLGSFAFTQVLAMPLLGKLSDRYGRRPVILLSLFANALAMGLFSLATYLSLLPLLFVSRILAGATSANISTCQAALADVSTRETRARAMGRLGAGIGLGMVLGPVMGGLLAERAAWLPPLLAGALALLDTIAVMFLLPETHPPEKRAAAAAAAAKTGKQSRFAAATSLEALAAVIALFFLVFLAISAMQVALALLAQARLGWGQKEVGYIFTIFGGLGLVIQGGLIGPLSKRAGEVNLVIVGALLLAGGMLGISLAWTALTLVGSLVLVGTGLGLLQPLIASLASQVAKEGRQGAILGLAQSTGALARTVGPVASGALFSAFGPSAPFASAATAGLVAASLGVLLRSMGVGKRKPASAAGTEQAPSGK